MKMYSEYNNVKEFLKNNMYKRNVSNIINDINNQVKKINHKQRVQLYSFYDFLFEEYGLDSKYIKLGFNEEQKNILDFNLNDFIEKAKTNKWFLNKTIYHVGSGFGRNLPLFVYLNCKKAIGTDADNYILKASESFMNLFKFKNKIELIEEDFLKMKGLQADIFYYIGGSIFLNTQMEKVQFYISMNKVSNICDMIIYTKDLFYDFNDVQIINQIIENDPDFEKIYNNDGFYIYQKKK